MAQTTLLNNIEPNNSNRPDGFCDTPFRRIEFHRARKPFTGFTASGDDKSDFRLETLNPTNPQQQQKVGSNQVGGGLGLTGKKRDGSEFFENGLDPELSLGITFRRIGAGLENLGNTCFLNSVLQCLTYTEPLAAYLQSGKHQISCRNAGFCALCAIQKHVSRALQSTGTLAPKDLVSNLRCISRTFRYSRQEDAHEYMVNLLESMHRCCLPSGVPSESPSAYEKSLVHKIFGGRLRSQVKCMQCSFCSNKFDPFLDLSLEIVKAESLYKAFANFTAKEQLDGGAKEYHCQQCKQKVKALKQLTIHKAPYVLTVHLKRFGSHISGQKIDKKVQFGPTLDLKPFVTGPYDGDLTYTLYGVLVHAGWSTHSGHYYCFVRTSSGMWYSLDDNRVVQVSEKKVFEQKAYMLFYFRDRKNNLVKKPVNVLQKEKAVINGTGRNSYPSINGQIIEALQKSTIKNKLNGLSPSDTVPLVDASHASAPKETIIKEGPVQESSCLRKCSDPTREEGRPKEHHQKNLLEMTSILHQVGDPCVAQSASPVVGTDNIKADDSKNMILASKIDNSSLGSSPKKDWDNFSSTPSSCNSLQSTVTIKEKNERVSELPSCKNITMTSGDLADSTTVPTNKMLSITPADTSTCITEKTCTGEDDVFSSQDPNKSTIVNADSIPISELNVGDIKVEDIPQPIAAGESPGDVATKYDRKMSLITTVELLDLPKPGTLLLQKKAHAHKQLKKSQNKFSRCQVTSRNLGSSILIGTSLSLWKKRKHKRGKKRILHVKTLTPCQIMDSIPIEQATSSSENVKRFTENRTDVKDTIGTSSSGDMMVSPVEKELKDRADRSCAVLATSSILRSQTDSKGPNSFQNGSGQHSKQNEFVKLLTRGLLEPIVPHWDDDSSSFQLTESRSMQNISIGYVGDEWDEEYDRGKRKKVRNLMDRFDGQNPFQEVAMKKARLNKPKSNHSDSANRPFRI